MNRPKISVVIPIYNEEAAIAANVGEVVKTLAGLGKEWELILVNDGSRGWHSFHRQRAGQRESENQNSFLREEPRSRLRPKSRI